MLSSGDLIHRVTIERRVDTQDPVTGLIASTWQTLIENEPAKIEGVSVREFIASRTERSEITTRITINYRPGITAADRVVHGGAIYNIHGVLPDNDTAREWLTLACSQGVSNG